MFKWFRKATPVQALGTDLHSHLLPGLDDGVQSFEEAAEVILKLKQLGFSKLITTPHIMSDIYRNAPADILEKCEALKTYLQEKNIDIEISAAAEYYLDESLAARVAAKETLLTFGSQYLLFELNFMVEPMNLNNIIFALITSGYKPVLAHPERYMFYQQHPDKLEDLIARGVLLQLNLASLTGYYSKATADLARLMIEERWVHFAGSDCHNLVHTQVLEEAIKSRPFRKLLSLPLLNYSL
ncbi:MAG: capsular biosynthesis protein [Cyclobacteriaceae bacterium]|nr:capsular biosynthesis protein [Cyclobacteriaceae bacterium]MDW8331215.1 CpsB/CapC family capsule biosynthesis tyrosine phosphatase [Cyclobacteriaceae bacterium]